MSPVGATVGVKLHCAIDAKLHPKQRLSKRSEVEKESFMVVGIEVVVGE